MPYLFLSLIFTLFLYSHYKNKCFGASDFERRYNWLMIDDWIDQWELDWSIETGELRDHEFKFFSFFFTCKCQNKYLMPFFQIKKKKKFPVPNILTLLLGVFLLHILFRTICYYLFPVRDVCTSKLPLVILE